MANSDKVIVELIAKMDRFNSDILRAQTLFENNMKKTERAARRAESTVKSSASNMANGLVKAFTIIGGVQTFRTLLDAGTRIDNSLKVAGLAGEELERVYQRLKKSALDNAAPLETLVTLYGRVAMVQKELNITQDEMLNFSERIALALNANGRSAAETSGAMLQLSQALGSGVVRAQEFNSMLDGALPIIQAAAAGLKEAGGSVSKLRQIVNDGKLSSEAFFRAIEAGAVILEDKVAGATLTTEQGFTNLGTALVDAMREFSQGSLAAKSLGEAFNVMAEYINSVDFTKFGEQARELLNLIGQLQAAMEWVQSAGANFGAWSGLDQIGKVVNALPGGGDTTMKSYLGGAITITSSQSIQDRIEQAAGEAVETAQELTEEELRRRFGGKGERLVKETKLGKVVIPVSVEDFDKPKADNKGGGSGKKGTKERANEYEQLSKRVAEATAALVAETEAQRNLNPLIDDHGYAVEKARLEHELLAAAQQAGVTVTPKLRAEIAALSEQYALATVEASKLAQEQDRARENAEKWLGVGRDVTKGLISDLMNGTSAADAFANALRRIGDALIDDVLNSIFQINGAGGGGILGAIFGLFGGGKKIPGFANGTPSAPGGLAIVGERGPELVNLPQGSQVIPNHRINSMGEQGGVTVNFNPVIDNRGASAEAVARTEQSLEKLKKELPSIVIASVRKAPKSNIKLGG